MSDIAVIGGTDRQGLGLALRWATAGFDVTIGSRDGDRARAVAAEARARLEALRRAARLGAASNTDAAGSSPIVVLCVPALAQADILLSIKPYVPDATLLIDVTVPLGLRGGRLLGLPAGSAAQQAAELAPSATRVVAAFHLIAAPALHDLTRPIDCDTIVCGDAPESRERVRLLAEAIPRVRYIDGGPLYNARLVEAGAALLVGLGGRYKARRAGLRVTGLP